MYFCGGYFRPQNHEVFSAHKDFRHAGIDIILLLSLDISIGYSTLYTRRINNIHIEKALLT